MKRDYAKGIQTGAGWNLWRVETLIRITCAEAIADTKRAERRRAARIAADWAEATNEQEGFNCIDKTELVKALLGRKSK